jgi:elongator complex protein 4
LHGQTLLSSGHPDLDRLLGGGLPLGALLLLLEDGWSGHHATLLRYFLAEGAACGQVGSVAGLYGDMAWR